MTDKNISLQDPDYEAGLRDGRIEALNQVLQHHNERLDKHERRLILQERVTFGLLGAIALLEFLPILQKLLSNG